MVGHLFVVFLCAMTLLSSLGIRKLTHWLFPIYVHCERVGSSVFHFFQWIRTFLFYDPDRFACVRIPTQIQINVTKQIQTSICTSTLKETLGLSDGLFLSVSGTYFGNIGKPVLFPYVSVPVSCFCKEFPPPQLPSFFLNVSIRKKEGEIDGFFPSNESVRLKRPDLCKTFGSTTCRRCTCRSSLVHQCVVPLLVVLPMLRLRWALLNNQSCLMHRLHIVIVHPFVALGVPWNHEQSFFFGRTFGSQGKKKGRKQGGEIPTETGNRNRNKRKQYLFPDGFETRSLYICT